MTYTEWEAGMAQADEMWSEARDTRPQGVSTSEWHSHIFYGAPRPVPFFYCVTVAYPDGDHEVFFGTKREALNSATLYVGAVVTDAHGHLLLDRRSE